MHVTDMTPAQRVANGVDWLDENGPAEWWDLIDYGRLNITDGKACVLGQVFADAASEVGMTSGYMYAGMPAFSGGHPNANGDTQRHGFCALDKHDDALALREEWFTAIQERKALVYT